MRTKSTTKDFHRAFGPDVDGHTRDMACVRTFAEIGKELGCSQQAASTFYERTIRKVARHFYREIFEARLHGLKMFDL